MLDFFHINKVKLVEFAGNTYTYAEKQSMKSLGELLGSSHKDEEKGGGDLFSSIGLVCVGLHNCTFLA